MKKIKWYKKDEILLKKLVRNYNAKRKRLLNKKGYDKELIPKKETYKDLKESIKTREDFNTIKEMLQVFNKRGSEKIVKKSTRGAELPFFMEKHIEILLKKETKEKLKTKKKYEDLPATDRNKKLGIKAKNFSDLNLSHLEPRNFNFKNKSKKELLFFRESLENVTESRDKKNKNYVDNFRKSLEKVLSPEHYNKIRKVIDQIPDEKILEKYYTDINMDLDFNYDDLVDEPIKYKVIFDSWNSLAQEIKKGSE